MLLTLWTHAFTLIATPYEQRAQYLASESRTSSNRSQVGSSKWNNKKSNNQRLRPKSNYASVLSPTFAGPMHITAYSKINSKYCFKDLHIWLVVCSLFLAAALVGFIFLFTRNHFSEHHHAIAIHERNTR